MQTNRGRGRSDGSALTAVLAVFFVSLFAAGCGDGASGTSGTTGGADGGGTVAEGGRPDAAPPAPTSFTVGGTLTGFAGSGARGLVLQNNGGDDVEVGANGAFTFPTKSAGGAAFNVTVKTQPTSPSQECVVSGGKGIVVAGNVTSVTVNCVTDKFTVGGTIAGLAGTVVLTNNNGDDLTVNSIGQFAFATPVASGAAYDVKVKTQPGTPSQTCAVTAGAGTVTSGNVGTVSISCTTNKFSVGGTVKGLMGGTLIVQNQAGDNVSITKNGIFAFPSAVASGSIYAATVLAHAEGHTCVITNPNGTVGGTPVTSVAIACTISFEEDFRGWTVGRTGGATGGGSTILVSGTTLSFGDTVQEAVSAAPLQITFDSPALPATFTALAPANGTKMAVLFAANNSTSSVARLAIAIPALSTTLTFNVQYASGIALDDTLQYVSVSLRNAATNAQLATLYKAGTGGAMTAPMTEITANVAAYANTSVVLELEVNGQNFPLYGAFDAFSVQ